MLDKRLYKHLAKNEVVPELHLTRWLRCVLSREYRIETCLLVWDFIFAGAYKQLKSHTTNDPLCNLDFVCVAMILSKKAELLESDFSMCLGILMSFNEPKSLSEDILSLAQKVRETVLEGVPYMQDSPRGED
jgi:TBC1 domain family protein 5